MVRNFWDFEVLSMRDGLTLNRSRVLQGMLIAAWWVLLQTFYFVWLVRYTYFRRCLRRRLPTLIFVVWAYSNGARSKMAKMIIRHTLSHHRWKVVYIEECTEEYFLQIIFKHFLFEKLLHQRQENENKMSMLTISIKFNGNQQ